MPLLHCNKCHHEWESIEENELCDWCGATSYVLMEKVSIETMEINKLFARDFLKPRQDFLKLLSEIKRLPQRQDSTSEQLDDLLDVGTRLGLYDACDYVNFARASNLKRKKKRRPY